MGKICGQESCPCYNNGSSMLAPIKAGASPRVLLLTDSPEMKDKGRIFSGDHSAFILDRIQKYGVASKIGNSFVCGTTIRCYADMSKLSESQKATAFKCCKSYFDEMMNAWKPELVICFGKMSLFGTLRHKGVKDKQGVLEYSKEYNCWVMPLYASGYILRNMTMEGTWVSGFNTVKNFIDAGWQPPSDEGKFEISEVQSIKGLFTSAEALDGIAIDTETQGLDWTHPLFTMISYSISPDGKRGYQIYLFEECLEHEKDYSILWERKQGSKKVFQYIHVKKSANFENKVRELRWFLENPDIKKIMHNGAYDSHVFKAFFKLAGRLLNLPQDKRTVSIEGYDFDTQNAAQLYNEDAYAQCKLETLQKDFTTLSERYDSGTFQGQADKGDMLSVPKDVLTPYAVKDCLTTKQASVFFKKFMASAPKIKEYFDKMVMPTVNTLIEMEHDGAYVDVPRLEQAQIDTIALKEEAHKTAIGLIPPAIIEAHLKKGIKLTRNDLVKDTLFSPFGFNIKPITKTKTGEPSADQDTIKLLQESVKSKTARDFMFHYTEYKKYDTLSGRYLSGFAKHRAYDGRIHSRFSICQAGTGRSSSQSPNVQNIPNRGDAAPTVRRIISVPKGKKILKADASQAELRWLAHYARDPVMLKIFRDGIIDIHTATAMGIVNFSNPKAWELLDDKQKKQKRKEAKPVNFGFCYGMSADSFVTYAKVEYGVDITLEEAEAYRDAYFKNYANLPVYYDRIVEFGKKHGYVESALGRRRRLPNLMSSNRGEFNAAMRQAINFPIQSASSDTVLLANNEIKKMGLPKNDFKIILFIHDELVAEVREDCDIDKYARIMKDAIENPPLKKLFNVDLLIPLVSEVEFGENLNDCKPWEFSQI